MGRAGLILGFGYAGWSDGTMGRPAAHRFSGTVHCTNEAVSRIKRCRGVCWEETLGERDRNVPHRPMGREQMWMLPPTLDEICQLNHPARFVVSSLTRWTDKSGQSLALRWKATLWERGIPSACAVVRVAVRLHDRYVLVPQAGNLPQQTCSMARASGLDRGVSVCSPRRPARSALPSRGLQGVGTRCLLNQVSPFRGGRHSCGLGRHC